MVERGYHITHIPSPKGCLGSVVPPVNRVSRPTSTRSSRNANCLCPLVLSLLSTRIVSRVIFFLGSLGQNLQERVAGGCRYNMRGSVLLVRIIVFNVVFSIKDFSVLSFRLIP